MWGGSYGDLTNGRPRNELPPHLATIFPPQRASGPRLSSYNNIGMTYDVQWFTATSTALHTTGFFEDQPFWRKKISGGIQKAPPFQIALDSLSGILLQFQRILKHATVDAYYDAMLPTRDPFQKSHCRS